MRSSGASRSSATTARLPSLIVIAGATASGKTRLALNLADHLGQAEIVSADSRQVFRGMDIGTAKVGPEDRARIPHHGLDLADPDEPFTAADFRRHALAALAGIGARGRVAILAGGTGLYLRVVARGVPVDEAGHDALIRAEIEARLAVDGPDDLVRELRELAPGLAGRTDLANPRRVVRALERARITGDQPPPAPLGYPGPVLWLGVRIEREAHDRAIAARSREQFDSGLLDEAAALRARYGDGLRAFSAMGYQEAFALLDRRMDRDTAIDQNAARTRAYARRQRTWFRSEPDLAWLPDGPGRLDEAIEAAARLLDPARPPTAADALS